jgi:phosphoribosylaminoimidazole-succinocarboxamide synthase
MRAFALEGKVRDVYEIDGQLLIVTTDRISAFDVVLPREFPTKGKVLNQFSCTGSIELEASFRTI